MQMHRAYHPIKPQGAAPTRTDRRAGRRHRPASELRNPGVAIGPLPDPAKADTSPGMTGHQYSKDRDRLGLAIENTFYVASRAKLGKISGEASDSPSPFV